MKAVYFEEPVDHYSCVERAWRKQLDEMDEQAIFLRSRPGQWSGKPRNWSIKYVLDGQASIELDGQWCEVYEGFGFVVPENSNYRSTLHNGRTFSVFGRSLTGVGPEEPLAIWGVFELTANEKQILNDCVASLQSTGHVNLPSNPNRGSKVELERLFPVPESWQETRLAVEDWLEKSPARLSSAHRLLRARHYLAARYREKNVCSQAAERANMTRSHFSREFNKLFGKSPRKYLVDYRTGVAGALLSSGRFSVEQVARRLGYRHPSSLNHLFRRNQKGCPGSLRGKIRPGDST